MGKKRSDAPKIEMCHDGAVNLIRGIVSRAKYDFLRSAPHSVIHKECEAFFLHPVFDGLTGMDGKMTLKKLQEQYDQKRQKKRHKEAEHCDGDECCTHGGENQTGKDRCRDHADRAGTADW